MSLDKVALMKLNKKELVDIISDPRTINISNSVFQNEMNDHNYEAIVAVAEALEENAKSLGKLADHISTSSIIIN